MTTHDQTTQPVKMTPKQKYVAIIAAFTASGDLPKLSKSLEESLNAGLTINEIKEVLVQMYAYVGFPRSLNGIGAMMSVLEARKKRGIHDPEGREASPLPTDKSNIVLGTETKPS